MKEKSTFGFDPFIFFTIVIVLHLKCLINYAHAGCDQTFMNHGGYNQSSPQKFYAPMINNPHGQLIQCIYTFIAAPGQRVSLLFNSFNLRGTPPECFHEFLDVYAEAGTDGGTSPQNIIDSPWGGRYCGRIPPRHRVSFRRALALAFTTDKNVTEPFLFSGQFSFINESIYEIGTPISGTNCSYVIVESKNRTGIIQTPTYPGAYPRGLVCNYQFIGKQGQRIRLEFRDFDLFFGGPHCPFDSVKIYDGLHNTSEIIGIYCGQQRNLVLYSSQETLLVTFSTLSRTAATQNRGFKGIFEFSESFVKLDFILTNKGEHIKGTECDQKILSKHGSSGDVVSPNYPFLYIPKTVCRYFIYGLQNAQYLERVKINFKVFSIPKGAKGDCSDGYLKIYLKGQEQTDSYDKFDAEACGEEESKPVGLVSDGPRLVLVFSSGDLQGRGFKARYSFETEYRIPGTAAPDGSCFFTYKSSSKKKGEINSPRYPSNYPSSTNCTYIFLANQDEQVTLIFDNFKIRADRANSTDGNYGEINCQEDWIEIYNIYNFSSDKLIGRYCKSSAPGPIASYLGAIGLKLWFHADSGNVYSGFKARYKFEPARSIYDDCGGHISNQTHGIVTSPNYPSDYKGPTQGSFLKTCIWYFTVSPGKQVYLYFEKFALEGNPADRGCSAAVLRLWYLSDGLPVEVCGEVATLDKLQYISDANTLNMTFVVADKSVGAHGWRAIWTEVSTLGDCPNKFQCSTNGYCIDISLRCNGINNCGFDDHSDEDDCFKEIHTDYSRLYQIVAICSLVLCLFLIICCIRNRRQRAFYRQTSPNPNLKMFHELHHSRSSLRNSNDDDLLPEQIPPPPNPPTSHIPNFLSPTSPIAGPSGLATDLQSFKFNQENDDNDFTGLVDKDKLTFSFSNNLSSD